jgi:hypothetical protein
MRCAVIDIGKPGKNLGWFLSGAEPEYGDDIDKCVCALASALREGSLAIGFEAPMFVPVRQEPAKLLAARDGECVGGLNRPFSAGAGSAVLVTALVVVTYVLARLKAKIPDGTATLDWKSLPSDPKQAFLFEAFVTDQRKSTPERHMEDAQLAVHEFEKRIRTQTGLRTDVTAEPCFNLLGAIMLRTGWSTDLDQLHRPCLVVRTSPIHGAYVERSAG